MKERVEHAQKLLQKKGWDGWLLYDFQNINPLARNFLNLASAFLTRRFLYWIPAVGSPKKLVHSIEEPVFKELPGICLTFRTKEEWVHGIQQLLKGSKTIAMEYSPFGRNPYVSKVDAGTFQLVRSFDVEVVSSQDLLQAEMSVLNEKMLETHMKASEILQTCVKESWHKIRQGLNQNLPMAEFSLLEFVKMRMLEYGLETNGAIVAVNAHSADPHFSPNPINALQILEGDLVMLDIWGKLNVPQAVFADITHMGIVGKEPTPKQKKVFDAVRTAQKAATDLVVLRFKNDQPLLGWEVDATARMVIEEAGFAPYFVHRTGHNIGTEDHGTGAHIDSYETEETREILPGTLFSIEPGIYIPNEFGVRLEYDVFVSLDKKITVTGGIQDSFTIL